MRTRPLPRPAATAGPDVAVLLDVDAEYRRRAAADELPKIAPRRLNPDRRAWLAVLHTHRDSWHFTALYSNTARAHQLGKTDDWVVLYFYPKDDTKGCTTEACQSDPGGSSAARSHSGTAKSPATARITPLSCSMAASMVSSR